MWQSGPHSMTTLKWKRFAPQNVIKWRRHPADDIGLHHAPIRT